MTSTQTDKSGDRQQQILDATLELVATDGLLNTSISKISKKAQCSPGIIYHYFESKDEIMDTLYLQALTEMTDYTFGNIDTTQPVLERYKDIWLKKYSYHINHPQQTRFIEEYKNSSYYTQAQAQELQRLNAPLITMGLTDIEQGLVVTLPLAVIYTMTLTVALNLAKDNLWADVTYDEPTLRLIAERCCQSILL